MPLDSHGSDYHLLLESLQDKLPIIFISAKYKKVPNILGLERTGKYPNADWKWTST